MQHFHTLAKATLMAMFTICAGFSLKANEDCAIAVSANVNVSLSSSSCTAAPTVAMVLSYSSCGTSTLTFQAYLGGTWVSNPVFNYTHVNQTFQFRVRDAVTGNFAQGSLKIEDKTAPVVTCGAAVTVNCEQMCAYTVLPTYSDCDPNLLKTVSETQLTLPCTSPNLKTIVRTYSATDAGGNVGSCVKTITVARRPISSFVFPAHITLQVTATDCSPWCENTSGQPAPSTTANSSLFAPGVPRVNSIPMAPVQNPGGCNGACIPDCGYTVAYNDAVTALCGTNRRIDRTWHVYNTCGNATSFIQKISIYTDGNTTCGSLCYRPTSLTHSYVNSTTLKYSWTAALGCVVNYAVSYRFKIGSTWNAWTTVNTTTNSLNVSIPSGAVQGEYYVKTTCYGTTSANTATYSFVMPAASGAGNEVERFGAEQPVIDWSAWPNPAQYELFMEFESPLAEAAQLRVYSSDGQLLSEQTLPLGTKQCSLDLSNQLPGLYLCQVSYGGKVMAKRVVVGRD